MGEHGGAVINTASVGGLAVSPNLGVYHVSKAALIHLTRQLALELAPKVRVNSVAPGIVRTRALGGAVEGRRGARGRPHALGRIGSPDDVAGAVAFLASDRASWITGVNLVIDGGQILCTAQPDATLERAA